MGQNLKIQLTIKFDICCDCRSRSEIKKEGVVIKLLIRKFIEIATGSDILNLKQSERLSESFSLHFKCCLHCDEAVH